MSFDLGKMFKDLEVKYSDKFNNGCTMTINVEPMKCDCDCSKTHDCCNDEKCCCHYEDIDDVDIDDYDEIIETPVTKIEMGNLDPIVAENAVTASSLRAYNEVAFEDDYDDEENDEVDEVEKEPEVKLINVNKNVSKALETIYDVIQEVNDDGETCAEFDLVEEFPELFENVRDVTMEKVLSRIARHLSENGFDVETYNDTNEYDNKVEKVYTVEVSW